MTNGELMLKINSYICMATAIKPIVYGSGPLFDEIQITELPPLPIEADSEPLPRWQVSLPDGVCCDIIHEDIYGVRTIVEIGGCRVQSIFRNHPTAGVNRSAHRLDQSADMETPHSAASAGPCSRRTA